MEVKDGIYCVFLFVIFLFDKILFCRYNSRGFDLNRNFPDYFKPNNKRGQVETDAVKEWISKIQFVLSGSFHGGALVRLYSLRIFFFRNIFISIFRSQAILMTILPMLVSIKFIPKNSVKFMFKEKYIKNNKKKRRGKKN